MEAIERDYSDKVSFYYVYRKLAHPENNGIVNPLTIEERVAQANMANRVLKTRYKWIVDNLNNELLGAFADKPNAEFILDAQGKLIVKRSRSRPGLLREDLANLVGLSRTTTPEELELDIDVKRDLANPLAESGVTKSLQTSPNLAALKVTYGARVGREAESKAAHVKLRAECQRTLLNRGKGKLVLLLYPDPIYETRWVSSHLVTAKLETSENFEATLVDQSKAPTSDFDTDPREFVFKLVTVSDEEPADEEPDKEKANDDGSDKEVSDKESAEEEGSDYVSDHEAVEKGPAIFIATMQGKFFVGDETVARDWSQSFEIRLDADNVTGWRLRSGPFTAREARLE